MNSNNNILVVVAVGQLRTVAWINNNSKRIDFLIVVITVDSFATA